MIQVSDSNWNARNYWYFLYVGIHGNNFQKWKIFNWPSAGKANFLSLRQILRHVSTTTVQLTNSRYVVFFSRPQLVSNNINKLLTMVHQLPKWIPFLLLFIFGIHYQMISMASSWLFLFFWCKCLHVHRTTWHKFKSFFFIFIKIMLLFDCI